MKPGWTTQEAPEYGAKVFSAPNNDGHVTVSYRDRCFRTGISYHGRADSIGWYRGRGWKERLENDAVAYLSGLLYGRHADIPRVPE